MPSTIVPHSNRLLLWLRKLSSLTRKTLELAKRRWSYEAFFWVQSSSEGKFFVLSCCFSAAVVFKSLSAMKINFSYRSLYRHSPWNFLLCATVERVNQRKRRKKHENIIFSCPQASATAENFSFEDRGVFFFSFELSQTFIHTFIGGASFERFLSSMKRSKILLDLRVGIEKEFWRSKKNSNRVEHKFLIFI